MTRAATTDRLAVLLEERERVLDTHLHDGTERFARACHDLARAVARGGVVMTCGAGTAAYDAAAAAAAFLHPGAPARPLPALGPAAHPASAERVARLGRPDDVALAIAHGPADDALRAFVDAAGRRGMLSIALVGPGGTEPDADHVLVVDAGDPIVVQEVQQTVWRGLAELVHVFLERPGLLDDACITCGDIAVAGRVVAFGDHGAVIERDGAREEVAVDLVGDVVVGDLLLCHAGVALEKLGEDAPMSTVSAAATPGSAAREHGGGEAVDAALADVRAGLADRAAAIAGLRRAIDLPAVREVAGALRARLDAGARLLAVGDAGSAAAAQDLAADALAHGWPAMAPVAQGPGALAEAMALGRHGDLAVAISGHGLSDDAVAALQEARRRGMVTCAIAGDGADGRARQDWLDHLLVVEGHDASRAGEAQTTIYHLLLDAIGGRT